MSAVTLPDMSKKKPPAAPAPLPADDQSKKGTGVIRVEVDLQKKLVIISTATGKEVKDIASPILRAEVERLYEEVVRRLGEDVKKPSP